MSARTNLPSSRERMAILFLSLLMFLIVALRIQLKRAVPQSPKIDLVSQESTLEVQSGAPDTNNHMLSPILISVNRATSKELVKAGLDQQVADRWVKYRKTIGGFKSKDDLARIYGLPRDWIKQHDEILQYDRVETSVQKSSEELSMAVQDVTVVKKKVRKRMRQPVAAVEKELVIDVNSANTYQWQKLPGIGEFYAKRIIKFRDKLGGFSDLNQIGDTYGLPDSVFKGISPMLQFSPIFRPLKINVLSANELKQHPYIKWKDATILTNYRKQHGDYLAISDLYKIRAFDSLFITRLAPYIDFDQSAELTQIAQPNE